MNESETIENLEQQLRHCVNSNESLRLENNQLREALLVVTKEAGTLQDRIKELTSSKKAIRDELWEIREQIRVACMSISVLPNKIGSTERGEQANRLEALLKKEREVMAKRDAAEQSEEPQS